MKYLKLILLFIYCSGYSQIIINKPKKRAVYQRDNSNWSFIPIKGKLNNGPIKSAKARLVTKNGGQNSEWENLSIFGQEFNGKVKSIGGWYTLEIEATDLNNNTYNLTNHLVGIGEVIVVAGQSNTLGSGSHAEEDRVIGLNYSGFNEDFDFFIDLTKNTNGRNTEANKWIGPNVSPKAFMANLGDKIVRQFQVPVAFFSTGASATTIQEWSSPNTEPYISLKNCLKYYNQEYGVRGVLWHQGETNSLYSTTKAEDYFEFFKRLVSNTRNDFGHEELAWSVAQVSWTKYKLLVPDQNDPNSIARRTETRNGQKYTYERINNVFQGPDSDILDGYGGSENRHDGIHFTHLGYERLAELWYQKLLETNFFNNTTPILNSTIPKQAQSINFNAIGNQVLKTKKIELIANSSAGLPIKYKIIDGPASINGNTLFFNGTPGKIIVEAMSEGNYEYLYSSQIQNFEVNKSKQNLNFNKINDVDLNTENIDLNANTNDGNPIKFKLNYGPAKLQNNKLILDGKPGEISINAFLDENSDYEGVSVNQIFKITKIKTELQIQTIPSVYVNFEPIQLTFNSNNPTAIKLELLEGPVKLEQFKITSLGKKGKVKIAVNQAENDRFDNSPIKYIEFEINRFNQNISFIKPNDVFFDNLPILLTYELDSKLKATTKIIKGPAIVKDSLITLTGNAGEVILQIAQNGNDTYNPILQELNFKVLKRIPIIKSNTIENQTYNAKNIFLNSNSTNTKTAITSKLINGKGIIQNDSLSNYLPGIFEIEFAQDSTSQYETATAKIKFEIYKIPQNITLENIPFQFNSTKIVAIKVNKKTNNPLQYEVKEGPAVIKDSTLVLTGQNGKVTLMAYQLGNDFYQISNTATISFMVNSLVSNEPVINLTPSVYPIPFNSTFTINTKNKPTKVWVYNSLGNEVFKTNVSSNGIINAFNLPSGIYWIAIFSDSKTSKPEIIKVQKL